MFHAKKSGIYIVKCFLRHVCLFFGLYFQPFFKIEIAALYRTYDIVGLDATTWLSWVLDRQYDSRFVSKRRHTHAFILLNRILSASALKAKIILQAYSTPILLSWSVMSLVPLILLSALSIADGVASSPIADFHRDKNCRIWMYKRDLFRSHNVYLFLRNMGLASTLPLPLAISQSDPFPRPHNLLQCQGCKPDLEWNLRIKIWFLEWEKNNLGRDAV